MTQEGTGPPDEFAHLFRPGDEPENEPPVAAGFPPPPQETPQGGLRFEDPPLPEREVGGFNVEESAPPQESAPPEEGQALAEPDMPVDPKEGRLFRSRGAPERGDAIVAIGAMQARRLRTLGRAEESVANAAPLSQVPEQQISPTDIPLPIAASGEPAPALHVMTTPAQQSAPRVRDEHPRDRAQSHVGSGSLTGLGVYAVSIGVTVILALGETFFFGGRPGVITGIGLLVVSIFAAFAVRIHDSVHAIFAPAIAYLIVTLTAGQIGASSSGFTGRAIVVFFLLGNNWIWIVGATAAALVIVALRRRVG